MDYQAIVIGGGHAGIEATLALARLGNRTLLITQNIDTIGKLSCNPAVGGLSKGNIVREIDALGGEMAKLIDASMIQFRILNRRKGPAVQAPRAQADKHLYARCAKSTLEHEHRVDLFQDTVVDLITEKKTGHVAGVVTARGKEISANVVVLTTGTFMEATVFIGDFTASSGRLGEPAAVGMGTALRKRGFSVGRLKTGTPARVAGSSLNYRAMEEQPGDPVMAPFSFSHDTIDRPDVSCWITFTNEETHKTIRENIDRSPLYSGKITGTGPRYCPSLEDKVVRFPDRDRHQIFVEPEGLGTDEMYLNGISSSLPEDVQERFLRTIAGLEEVVLMRPGYAVEYDFLRPTELFASLESKIIPGLFVAGQTNGTSGYEEAAGQGLIAGINAGMMIQHEEPLILARSEAYIGVLIDDLVTLGTEEPYRMFTSRAEYRLNLRHDSADIRLTPRGRDVGLVTDEAFERLNKKEDGIRQIREVLTANRTDSGTKSLMEAIKTPGIDIGAFSDRFPELIDFPQGWREQVEMDIKYAGYLSRQDTQIRRFQRMENVKIPRDFDYRSITGLSTESMEKLTTIRPYSVGQASRISGVRNGDIAILMVHLSKDKKS